MLFKNRYTYVIALKTAVITTTTLFLLSLLAIISPENWEGLLPILVLIFLLPPTLLVALRQRWALVVFIIEFGYVFAVSAFYALTDIGDLSWRYLLDTLPLVILSGVPLLFFIRAFRLPNNVERK